MEPSLRLFVLLRTGAESSILPSIDASPDALTPERLVTFLPIAQQTPFIEQGRNDVETSLDGFRVGFNPQYSGYCFYMSCPGIEIPHPVAIVLQDDPEDEDILAFSQDLYSGSVFNSPVPPLVAPGHDVVKTPDGFLLPLALPVTNFDEVFTHLRDASYGLH